MPTPNTNSNPNSVPAPFHLGRALIAQGWNNNPGAQRAVGEFAVHAALSDIASRIVKKFDDSGKQIGTNPMSAGDVLNLLNNLPEAQRVAVITGTAVHVDSLVKKANL